MRVVPVPANRTASIRELRGGIVLLLAAGVEIALPKVNGDNYVAIVKAAGAGCKVSSAAAGLEIGEGATSGDPLRLTLTTSDVTLLAGESREYVWDGTGWIMLRRSIPPSAVRLGSQESILIGTGDGSAVNFDLPTADVAHLAVFVAGAILPPASYSISAGAGTGGVDRLVLGTAPTSGQAIVGIYLRKTAV